MLVLAVASSVLIGYCFGCFNGAIVISKYILRDDIRKHGSGNAGITNFLRTFGGPLTFMVLLCDVLKVVLAVLITGPILASCGLHPEAPYITGLAAMLGHIFPVFFRFKGGKGVLSTAAFAWMIDWRVCLLAIAVFLVIVLLTRYISLGSIFAAAALPVLTALLAEPSTLGLALVILCGAVIIIMHYQNIGRLLRGKENRFSLHRKKKTEGES